LRRRICVTFGNDDPETRVVMATMSDATVTDVERYEQP
jgi:hypothetical protein